MVYFATVGQMSVSMTTLAETLLTLLQSMAA